MRSHLTAVVLGLVALACAQAAPSPKVERYYRISGMTCSSCVEALTETLRGLGGVHAVEIGLQTGVARVRCDADLDPAAVVAAVEDLGYGAEGPWTADPSETRDRPAFDRTSKDGPAKGGS
ncbi:MAG TPA: heavy metal-associated domain-containing protein [Myxococcales bacterium LLY-WYZ-16_1]|nr:heavy metal-associated domain-containing protein [Myxococcales bacterium LLY-WYZ-16_1]